MMGSLHLIASDTLFLITGTLARFLQGATGSAQIMIGIALLSLSYQRRIELIHIFLQIAINLGFALGPFLGSFIYKSLGYAGPLLAATAISVPPLLLPCAMKNIEFPNDKG